MTILEQRIEMQCGEYSFEQLQQEAASWPEDLRSVKDIGNEIRILCNAGSVDGFLAVRESRLRDYQKLYGTQQALTDLAETKREELENNQKKLKLPKQKILLLMRLKLRLKQQNNLLLF